MELTKLPDAAYTPLITRGTNKFRDKTVILILGTENLNPNVAKFLCMDNGMSKFDHQLSELIQVIYRTAIRDNKPVTLISADESNIISVPLLTQPWN